MSRSATRYGRAMGLVAAGALVLSTVPAGGALAAPAAPSSCTITGIAPAKVPVGSANVTRPFTVKTTGCTVTTWSIDFGGGVVLNQDTDALEIFAHKLSNDVAGVPLDAKAKVTSDVAGETAATKSVTWSIQRRATWASTFNATPEPVKKGKRITVKGTLTRISWTKAKKLPFVSYAGRTVTVQFRAKSTDPWTNIKTLKTNKAGKISTTVKAVKTGTWRVHFAGNAATSVADSTTDAVVVN